MQLLMVWPVTSSLYLGLAYWLNSPRMVLGKQADGSISWFLFVFNMPWLLLTYVLHHLQKVFTKEARCHEIIGHNIWIGRMPGIGSDVSGFEQVIDLTAEFTVWYQRPKVYVCCPNLDGIALKNFEMNEIDATLKTLIHCAQGHGRSATFLSQLLASKDPELTPLEALHLIQKQRPHAKPSSGQLDQLK